MALTEGTEWIDLGHALIDADQCILFTRCFDLVRRDQAKTSALFEFTSERYERKGLAITANTPFSQWGKLFVETATTLATIHRLVWTLANDMFHEVDAQKNPRQAVRRL